MLKGMVFKSGEIARRGKYFSDLGKNVGVL